MLTRRHLMLIGLATALPLRAVAENAPLAIHVVKDRNCGCCGDWIAILEQDGFSVTTENSLGTALIRHKLDHGIPAELASCHTAQIEGYMIEGHVPPADIRHLLAERPDAIGLAVPGMPYGSPGMGREDQREAYDVLLIARDGSAEVFSHYPAA